MHLNLILCSVFLCPRLLLQWLQGPLGIVSHNFTGAKFHSNSNEYKPISFMAIQVETACNWGGWLGIQLSGGLNCKYMFYIFLSVYVILYIIVLFLSKIKSNTICFLESATCTTTRLHPLYDASAKS